MVGLWGKGCCWLDPALGWMEALIEGAWYLQTAALRGSSCPGRRARRGVRWGLEVMLAPRKGVGLLLGSPVRISHCLGQGQLTEAAQTRRPHVSDPHSTLTMPSLRPFPLPSGPPRRKPSSGASPWRNCCFTNVSGGQRPTPLPCVLSLLSRPPLLDQRV